MPSRKVSNILFAIALLPAVLTAAVRWGSINKQAAEWYAGPEARSIAASIIQYQTPEGGWAKNTDMSAPPPGSYQTLSTNERAPTIDNGATTTQLQFLARVATAANDEAARAAFYRGFDYLIAAQYPNGGWPQFFPLRQGYYTHITYNDNAMVEVLAILRDSAEGQAPFAFVDAPRRAQAAAAVERAIACILRTQIKQDGRLTGWCAQHDENSFEPAWARNFEPPSTSGNESVGLVRFLMSVKQPTPEIIAAVEGAVVWFESVRVRGLRIDNTPGPDGQKDRRAVADPAATDLWARFYELGTNRPIFVGRDRTTHIDFNAIERERRVGYAYYGTWPATLLAKDYPRWRAKHQLP